MTQAIHKDAQLSIPLAAPKPMTDCDRVLEVLRAHRGGWVAHPYSKVRCMWHSRVADLRKKGYVIDTRRVDVPGDRADYQYKLSAEGKQ